jgi:hypothetical protein
MKTPLFYRQVVAIDKNIVNGNLAGGWLSLRIYQKHLGNS